MVLQEIAEGRFTVIEKLQNKKMFGGKNKHEFRSKSKSARCTIQAIQER